MIWLLFLLVGGIIGWFCGKRSGMNEMKDIVVSVAHEGDGRWANLRTQILTFAPPEFKATHYRKFRHMP